MTTKFLIIAAIGIILAGTIPTNVYALDTEEEQVAKRERFYDSHPEIERPVDISSEAYGKGSKDDLNNDGLIDDPAKPLSGPDPACNLIITLQNGPMASLFKGKFDKYNERCGIDEISTEASGREKLESYRDNAANPKIRNQAATGLQMADCAEGHLYDTLSDTEREECDTLMLDIKAICDDDPTNILCTKSGPNNFNPMEYYVEENNLEDSDNEDNEEDEDQEEDSN